MRALTTSEAVATLIGMGFKNREFHTIKDNEFTIPFGKTYINPNPKINKFYNIFTEEWVEEIDISDRVIYKVCASEHDDGKSYLYIFRFEGNSGHKVVDYAKLNAAQKKAFMEIMIGQSESIL